MGIGSSGVVNCANTYLGTANYTVADGYVADRTPIVDGNGPAQLNLNFARNEVLDPRITFSRTSNATRVNAQGLIEYAPHNLLPYSEQFDNAVWGKSGVTVTANAIVAPDGTLTTDALVEDNSLSGHRTDQTVSANSTIIYTTSYYVKANGRTWASLLIDTAGNGSRAYYNLATGQVGTIVNTGTGSSSTASIISVGGGWYRCTLSCIPSTVNSGSVRSYISGTTGDNTPTYTGTTSLISIYIWGAQLNIGSLQPYYTTSVKNLLGYSQNFENAAWTKSNSSVLTNLLTYSQEFDNVSWNKTGVTVTANAVVAPDGTTTADKLVENTVNGAHSVTQTTTVISGTKYTSSVYAKAGERTEFILGVSADILGPSTYSYARFNLITGTASDFLGAPSYSITNIGGGWYRCSVTYIANVSGTGSGFQLQLLNATGQNVYTGDGASGIYIWGAQLVQGTNPEEYTVTTSAPAPIQVMGPLGFLGAEKLVEDTAIATEHRIASATITWTGNGQYTVSFYAKAAGRTKFDILFGTSANWVNGDPARLGSFDLTTGTLRATPTLPGIASITNIGNGWFRCSITSTAIASPSASSIFFRLCDASGSATYTGDGTSGIYIFGAQLSDSASLDPYVYNFGAAPTSSAYYGPRFDYDPVTLAPKGLLIEEQRINILLNSDTLSTQSVSVTAQAYTLSFYGTGSVALSGAYTGSLVGTGVYPNRVQLTFTPAIGTLTLTVTGSVRYANLEAGAFPTSYIPTTSTQVTRTADNASMVGTNFSSWYNQSEGTVAVETDVNYPASATGYPITIGVNFNDSLTVYRQSDAQPVLRINTAGVNYYLGAYGNVWSDNLVKKLALGYQANNTSSAYNGLGSATDTTVTLPVATQLSIGSFFNSSSYINGHIQSFKFFSKRFINTYLQSLTQ